MCDIVINNNFCFLLRRHLFKMKFVDEILEEEIYYYLVPCVNY